MDDSDQTKESRPELRLFVVPHLCKTAPRVACVPLVTAILLVLVFAGGCRTGGKDDGVRTQPSSALVTAIPAAARQTVKLRTTATPEASSVSGPTPPPAPTPPPKGPAVSVLVQRLTPTPTPTAVPTPSSPERPTPTAVPIEAPTVTIGDVAFRAEVASEPAERFKGLSGRGSLPPLTGMLFVFESGRTSSFWMRGMLFPLDFIWIGGDCTVVDTTLNAPAPAAGTADSALATYLPATPAAYTFEVNAGEVEQSGIQVGDEVRFSGFSVLGADC